MNKKFPVYCSKEQSQKVNEILELNIENSPLFGLDYIFNTLPDEIIYKGNRGDLSITPLDISYFSTGNDLKINLIYVEPIPADGNIFDAFIKTLEWLKENNLIDCDKN